MVSATLWVPEPATGGLGVGLVPSLVVAAWAGADGAGLPWVWVWRPHVWGMEGAKCLELWA